MNDIPSPPPSGVSPVILYVDDEAAALKYFQRAIGAIGAVATAASVDEGRRMLDLHQASVCVLICDQRMPGAIGNELLQYARERYPHVTRILTTAYSEVDHTVEAINNGHIFRYIAKPWDITGLRVEIKQALDHARLWRERDQLLREKLLVGQRQILWNRIAAVHALCVSLGPASEHASSAYLAAAKTSRTPAPEPDWARLDLVDVISLEATRTGKLAARVIEAVPVMRSTVGADGRGAMPVLAMLAGGTPLAAEGHRVAVADASFLTEFIDLPPAAAISDRHVQWLALLIAMDHAQQALDVVHDAAGLALAIAPAGFTPPAVALAAWLENY